MHLLICKKTEKRVNRYNNNHPNATPQEKEKDKQKKQKMYYWYKSLNEFIKKQMKYKKNYNVKQTTFYKITKYSHKTFAF